MDKKDIESGQEAVQELQEQIDAFTDADTGHVDTNGAVELTVSQAIDLTAYVQWLEERLSKLDQTDA